MKILIVRPQFEWGGATISILRLAESLQDMGNEVLLAASGGELFDEAARHVRQVYRIPLAPSSPAVLLRAVAALRRIVVAEGVDVLHSHHRFSNLACRLVSALTGVPMVSTVHEYKHNLRLLTRLGVPGPVITFSNSLREHITSHYRVPADKIHVVEMGVREAIPAAPPGDSRTRTVKIGCFARLVEEKGVDLLMRAAEEAPLYGRTNVEFLVVGDGPLRMKLEAQAHRLDNGIKFRFLGWVEEIEKVLPKVSFIVLPSRTEGFGMVILEGLRYRKPSIASAVGSIPELIEDGRTGLLVPPDDPRRFAEAISTFLEDEDNVRAMGETGFNRIAQRYSVQEMGIQVMRIYEKALQGKRV